MENFKGSKEAYNKLWTTLSYTAPGFILQCRLRNHLKGEGPHDSGQMEPVSYTHF